MAMSLLEEVYAFLVEKIGILDFDTRTDNVNLIPLSNIDYRDKIRGAMMGLAMGEAYRESTILLAESLIINQTFNPEDLANRMARQSMDKSDEAMSRFILNYKQNKMEWYKCGVFSLNGGAVIRGLPIALINYGDFNALRLTQSIQTIITHMNEASIVASILFATATTYLLNTPAYSIQSKEDVTTFINMLCKSIRGLEAKVYSIGKNGEIANLYTMINRVLREWLEREAPIEEVMQTFPHQANILEGIPISLYIFLRNPSDYEKAFKNYLKSEEIQLIRTMTLILFGSYLGFNNMPKSYIHKLEIHKEVYTLSDRLFELSLKNKNNNPYRRMRDQIEIERSQDELDRLVWLGIKYNKEEKYELAIKSFEELIEKSPDFKKNERVRLHIIEAYEGLGTEFLEKESHEEALKYFKKALGYDINHPIVLCDIAITYLNMDHLDKAEKYARRAVEIAPEYEIGREVLDGIKSLRRKN